MQRGKLVCSGYEETGFNLWPRESWQAIFHWGVIFRFGTNFLKTYMHGRNSFRKFIFGKYTRFPKFLKINISRYTVGRVRWVKPILQLFSLLLSINWMGVALVRQHIVHARQRCQIWCHASHRRRHTNYLAVATRWSTSVIKVSGQMRSDKFKRWLGFSFKVIVLA